MLFLGTVSWWLVGYSAWLVSTSSSSFLSTGILSSSRGATKSSTCVAVFDVSVQSNLLSVSTCWLWSSDCRFAWVVFSIRFDSSSTLMLASTRLVSLVTVQESSVEFA